MRTYILTGLVALFVLLRGMPLARAGADDAADSIYEAGWNDGSNGGNGFGGWQLTAGTAGGFFVGSSADNAGGSSGTIDVEGRAWGMWSSTGVTEAVRSLGDGSLSEGMLLKVSMDNGYIVDGRSAGIALRNASGATLWEFYFYGGGNGYAINDGYGANESPVPFSGDGLQITFMLTGSAEWLAQVTSGAQTWNISGTLMAETDQSIAQFRAWNYEAGEGSDCNFYINSLSVETGSVELAQRVYDSPAVDTGLGVCLNDSTIIDAPDPGMAFYGQDAQYAGHQARYLLGNGCKVVHDLVTGLTWQQTPDIDDDGDIDVDDKLTWDEMQTYPDALNNGTFGGYSDWRLPTIKEQYSLIDFRGTDPDPMGTGTDGLTPFIDSSYFDFAYGDTDAGERIIDSQYGSSSLYVGPMDLLFGVNFADGRIKGYGLMAFGGGDKTFLVMCCRGNTNYGRNVFVDNGDGTVSDNASGLMWQQADSLAGMNWEEALAYAENLELGGYRDWRLPNVKELQGLVDYTRSPDTSDSAAIDSLFSCSKITNMAGAVDYPFYWSGTTHFGADGNGGRACYVAFGRGLGTMDEGATIIDIHGAGCQRSDPKTGDPADYPNAGNGPQGDVCRVFNHVRCVRGGTDVPQTDSDGDGLTDWFEYNYSSDTTGMEAGEDTDGDGATNYEEGIAGTDPTDAESAFEMMGVDGGTSSVTMSWTCEPGKIYALEMCTNLLAGRFTAVESGIAATMPMCIHAVEQGEAAVFYRVVVE